MTSIAPRSTGGYVVDDPSWLGSEHGTDATETATLDISKFAAQTHYPNGVIPSGTAIGKVTATGLYGPYKTSGSDGDDVLVGFTVAPCAVESGVTRIAVGVLTHGRVVRANLPIAIDSNAVTDVAGRIRFV